MLTVLDTLFKKNLKMGLNLRKHVSIFSNQHCDAENKIILHLCTILAYIGLTKGVKI